MLARRTFSGKRFYLWKVYNNKHDAVKEARESRGKHLGKMRLARVTKSGRVWQVWCKD